MEQDIIDRLRIMAANLKWTAGEHTAEVLNEAAAEIEGLRKELTRYKKPLIGNQYHGI